MAGRRHGKVVVAPGVPVLGDPARTQADQLAYMADMISELQRMADQSGLVTLAGILALAHVEARLCLKRSR